MADLNNDIPKSGGGAVSLALPRLSIVKFAPDPVEVDATLGRPVPGPTVQEAQTWPYPSQPRR